MKSKFTLIAMLMVFSASVEAAGSLALKNELQVTNEHEFAFELAAKGVQVYDCKQNQSDQPASWQFRAPKADLFDQQGQAAGTHYAGPSWAGLDQSVVTASVLAKQDSPDSNAIPWLLLQANKTQGQGKFANISYIQRLATVGGKAPAGTCQLGTVSEVAYTAQYRFFVKKTSKAAQATPVLIVSDALRMAKLLENGKTPDADQLQRDYLDGASAGVGIFTPHRIQNAAHLAGKIAENRVDYQHALQFCLPIAAAMQDEVANLQKQVQYYTGRDDAAPVYIVLGAGNSGGTASEQGLVLGLEVICKNKRTADEVLASLRAFIRHELVHVYQSRAIAQFPETKLATQVLMEGYADFIAELISGQPAPDETERHAYGLAHEASLWQAFQADLQRQDVDAVAIVRNWMYNNFAANRDKQVPADLGYWIGKRLCQAYYQAASDKVAASRTMLTAFLQGTQFIQASTYRGAALIHDEGGLKR